MERTHAENKLVACVGRNRVFASTLDRFTHWYGRGVVSNFSSLCLLSVNPHACTCAYSSAYKHLPCAFNREKKRRTGIISTCQQWVFERHEDSCLRVFSLLVCFPAWLLLRDQKVKVLGRKPKKACYSQTTNGPAFICGNAERRKKRGRKESKDGGMRRRRSAFTCGGGRRLGWLVFLK